MKNNKKKKTKIIFLSLIAFFLCSWMLMSYNKYWEDPTEAEIVKLEKKIDHYKKKVEENKQWLRDFLKVVSHPGSLSIELKDHNDKQNRLWHKINLAQERIHALKEQQQLKQQIKIHKTKLEVFYANQTEILAKLETLINQNKFYTAQKELKKYDLPEISHFFIEIKTTLENKLYEQVKKIPYKNYRENYNYYCQLVTLNPSKELYKKKRDHYKLKLAQMEKKLNEKNMVCYELGLKFGRCAEISRHGQQCDPTDNIIMPVKCREKFSTKEGIKDGIRMARSQLGIISIEYRSAH